MSDIYYIQGQLLGHSTCAGSHDQKGLALSLMLCCHHLGIHNKTE